MFTNLPDDILYHIFTFIDKSIDLVNLCMTCNKINKIIKNNEFNSTYNNLNFKYLEEEKYNFIGKFDIEVYDYIPKSIIKYQNKIKSIKMYDVNNFKDIIWNFENIELELCENIETLSVYNCKRIKIIDCDSIKDLYINKNCIDELTIYGCENLDISNKNFIVRSKLSISQMNMKFINNDIFKTPREINLYSLEIDNISNFINCESVSIQYCRNIIDISPLRNCKKIIFVNLNISDISCLKNCEQILLVNCENISDISSLKNCKDVHINNCNKIDYSILGNQDKLIIINSNIKDISNLKYVKYLSIINSRNIIDFSYLGNQETLFLSNVNIKNINHLKNVKNLYIF